MKRFDIKYVICYKTNRTVHLDGGSMKKEEETSGARNSVIAAMLLISIGVVGTAAAVIATANRRDHEEPVEDHAEHPNFV